MKTEKKKIRLNEKELRKAAIDYGLETKAQIAEAIGVSRSQLWRATKPTEHRSYNEPGPTLIAGVLNVFGGNFEQFFFLEESDTNVSEEGV